MSGELLNLCLFFLCAAKMLALVCWPAPIALAFFGARRARFSRPVKLGELYRIEEVRRGAIKGAA